jgi:hypothetical protein
MPAPSFSPDDDEAVSNEVPGSKKIIKLQLFKVPRDKLVTRHRSTSSRIRSCQSKDPCKD